MYFWGGIREPTKKKGELFSELDMTSLPTDEILKQRNERTEVGAKEKLSLVQIYFLFISILACCVLLGWNQRAKKKEGRAVSELTVTSLRKPMRFETKKRKNGGAGGGTLPQRGATGGGVRRRGAGCGGIAQWQIAGA